MTGARRSGLLIFNAYLSRKDICEALAGENLAHAPLIDLKPCGDLVLKEVLLQGEPLDGGGDLGRKPGRVLPPHRFFPAPLFEGSTRRYFWSGLGVGGRRSPWTLVRSAPPAFPPRGPTISYWPDRGAI